MPQRDSGKEAYRSDGWLPSVRTQATPPLKECGGNRAAWALDMPYSQSPPYRQDEAANLPNPFEVPVVGPLRPPLLTRFLAQRLDMRRNSGMPRLNEPGLKCSPVRKHGPNQRIRHLHRDPV